MSNNGSFNTNSYDGRHVQFSWSVASQSIVNNNTTINWSISAVGGKSSWYKSNPTSVYINGNRVYYNGTRVQQYKGTIASGSYTISHDNNGNGSFNASVSSAIYSAAVNCNGYGSWGLPQIARYPVIQSASDFDDTGNPSLTFTNPSRLYPIRVKIEASGNTQLITRDIGNNATSYTFDLTESERNKLRKLTPNSNKLSVWLTVCAMNGNSELSASHLGRTMTIVNANPTVEKNEYYDTNQKTTDITNDNQIIIRNNSKLEFKLTSLSALKYATLSKAEILLNGITKSATLSGSSAPSQIIDFGIVNSSSDLTASIVVTDSRGNKTSYSKDITIVDWVQPSAIINCKRKNNFYSTTDLTVDGSISSINDKNVMKIQYQYKKTTDTNYSTLKTIQDNTQTSFDIDNNFAWDIRIIVSDLLGSTTYNLFVDKGIPIVYFDRLLSSMGVNCFPNEEKSLSLNGEKVLTLDSAFPVGAVYITFNNNNPGNFLGGTWVQFGQGRTLIGQGTGNDGSTEMSFTATSQGGEYRHALSLNEMPSHAHKPHGWSIITSKGANTGLHSLQYLGENNRTGNANSFRDDYEQNRYGSYVGNNEPHNIVQPYLVVFFWRRVS